MKADHLRLKLSSAIVLIGLGMVPAASIAQTAVPSDLKARGMSIANLCRADFESLCPGVRPGGGRIVACLGANVAKLSPACRAALPDAQNFASKAAAAGARPK
jgi:hypothetical protein